MRNFVISEERLRSLLESEDALASLEDGGVDNWDWYDESLKDHRENFEKNLPKILKEFEEIKIEN